jgi:hypothetical protein
VYLSSRKRIHCITREIITPCLQNMRKYGKVELAIHRLKGKTDQVYQEVKHASAKTERISGY